MTKSFREALIGTWKLVEYSIENIKKPGERFYPLGKDATGFIMYTPDGYMSAQMMAAGRPAYENGGPHNGTLEEMAQAAKGYMAYAGQYEVNEETQTLIHHMEVSMNPTWLSQAQERCIKLNDDTITITAPNTTAILIWKRADDHFRK